MPNSKIETACVFFSRSPADDNFSDRAVDIIKKNLKLAQS
jgi:hypothetical protein